MGIKSPVFLVLIIACLFSAITPVSAEILEATGGHYAEYSGTGYQTSCNIDRFTFYKIEEWDNLEFIYLKAVLSSSADAISYLTQNPYYSQSVTLTCDGNYIGSGTANYNVLFTNNLPTHIQFWIDVDDFDTGSLTGKKAVLITPSQGVLWGYTTPTSLSVQSLGTTTALSDTKFVGWNRGGTTEGTTPIANGLVFARTQGYWKNEITYDENKNTVYLKRVFDKVYYSKLDATYTVSGNPITISDDTFSNTSVVTSGQSTVTWTVTDIFGGIHSGVFGASSAPSTDFALSLSPTSAAVGDPVQATLTPAADAPTFDMVEWTIADDWRPYRLVTGTWYAYNTSTETYADAVTEADVLEQTCQFSAEGNGPVFCRVYDLATGTLLADLKEYVTVSGTSALKWPLYVAVFDADTGATLMSTSVQITDLDTSEVTTTTIQTSHSGETFLLDSSDRYQIVVSKTSYESRTWTNIRSDTSRITAYLPKTAVPGNESQVSLYFRVHSTAGSPVAGAYVQLSPGDISGLTNSQGQVVLTVSKNTTYSYQVSASGYVGATDSLDVSATSLWYECTLATVGGTPTTTAPAGVVTIDTRTIDEKATSALDILFDNVEAFATLAAIGLITSMIYWIIPGGRRR